MPDEKILGKFEDQGALEKAYLELERKLSSAATSAPPPSPTPTMTPPPPPPAPTPETVSISEELSPYVKEYIENNGALGEASLKTLSKRGVSPEVAQLALEGMKAKATSYTDALVAHVGGKEVYDNLMQWGSTNLAPEEISAFNKAMQSLDAGVAKLALDSVKAKASAKNPELLTGKAATYVPVQKFTQHEAVQAFQDPRMYRDAVYTNETISKLLGKRTKIM